MKSAFFGLEVLDLFVTLPSRKVIHAVFIMHISHELFEDLAYMNRSCEYSFFIVDAVFLTTPLQTALYGHFVHRHKGQDMRKTTLGAFYFFKSWFYIPERPNSHFIGTCLLLKYKEIHGARASRVQLGHTLELLGSY